MQGCCRDRQVINRESLHSALLTASKSRKDSSKGAVCHPQNSKHAQHPQVLPYHANTLGSTTPAPGPNCTYWNHPIIKTQSQKGLDVAHNNKVSNISLHGAP